YGPNNFYPNPIWTPDGKRVTYNTDQGMMSSARVFWKSADGIGPEEQLTSGEHDQAANSWSPDGKELLFTEWHPVRGGDIWVFSLQDRQSRPVVQTPFHETAAAFSPDGRWIAYHSNESGRQEVYVQGYPAGRKWQVSTDGGAFAVWAPDGSELFYLSANRVMSARLRLKPGFSVEKPTKLFEGRYEQSFVIAPDGRRFLMLKGAEPDLAPTRLNVVLNWLEELKQRAR
ncbi:MAG: TolB family protein, partial [Gammaproteobacteria bacterium]